MLTFRKHEQASNVTNPMFVVGGICVIMIPYENQIKISETLSFNVNGVIMPVQVTRIGYDEITAVSLDLKFKWQISKSKWIKQRELLQNIGVK